METLVSLLNFFTDGLEPLPQLLNVAMHFLLNEVLLKVSAQEPLKRKKKLYSAVIILRTC